MRIAPRNDSINFSERAFTNSNSGRCSRSGHCVSRRGKGPAPCTGPILEGPDAQESNVAPALRRLFTPCDPGEFAEIFESLHTGRDHDQQLRPGRTRCALFPSGESRPRVRKSRYDQAVA
jgi:hypothetical protein